MMKRRRWTGRRKVRRDRGVGRRGGQQGTGGMMTVRSGRNRKRKEEEESKQEENDGRGK